MNKKAYLSTLIALTLIVLTGACHSSKVEGKKTEEATSKVTQKSGNITTASVYSSEDLNGEWSILSIDGKEIAAEKETFLRFDAQTKRIHGKAGCNTINSAYETNESNIKAISFKPGVTTRMACVDMEAEDLLLKALPEIAFFSFNADKSISYFQDKAGKEILKLKKK